MSTYDCHSVNVNVVVDHVVHVVANERLQQRIILLDEVLVVRLFHKSVNARPVLLAQNKGGIRNVCVRAQTDRLLTLRVCKFSKA